MRDSGFSAVEVTRFRENGYAVARGLLDAAGIARLRAQALAALAAKPDPRELEHEVGYPGAPRSAEAPGGGTPRRLLDAYARGGALAEWARDPRLLTRVQALLDSRELWLCQAHHNCVMTKHPRFSSDTGWHQDLRYWSFEGRDLVNAWLALGAEYPANGGLHLIPGSHRWTGLGERLDEARFLRPDDPANRAAIATADSVNLEAGDVLFFHAGLFHSASRNLTDELKLSVVFTYHPPGTTARAGTKSASRPEIPLCAAPERETRAI